MAEAAATLPPSEQQAAWSRQNRGQRLETLRLGRLTGTNPLTKDRMNVAVAPRALTRFASAQLSDEPRTLRESFEAEREDLETPKNDPVQEQQRVDQVSQIKRGNAAERFVRLQSLRAARKNTAKVNPAEAAISKEISDEATKVYTLLWQRGHELIEALAFQFFMLAALIVGPISVGAFLIRFFVGNAFNGGTQIQFREVSVPLVPPMSPTEIIYRGSKNGLIGIVFLLEWTIIIVIIYVAQHPDVALKLGFAALADAFAKAIATITGTATQ